MAFPTRLALSIMRHVVESRLREVVRFPLALMLEPTFLDNVACGGHGHIDVYRDNVDRMLSAEECVAAVDEAGAPVVCVTGGEPLIHPDIELIINGILERRKFLYLFTNGLIAEDFLSSLKPGPGFAFVFRLDGMAESHDRVTARPGLFEKAILAIQAAKKAGFQVYTRTTVYRGVSVEEIETLFVLLSRLNIDGIMVAPASQYGVVESDVLLSREETAGVFGPLYEKRSSYPLHTSPVYLEFLAGRRHLACVPWGNPTRDPLGWRQPCRLMADRYCQSYHELMENTEWDRYGVGRDPRCGNCALDCGFEAGAVGFTTGGLSGLWDMARWKLLRL